MARTEAKSIIMVPDAFIHAYEDVFMKKRVMIVDVVAIVSIFFLLVAGILLKFEEYLFRLPFVTLFAFYLIGKYARDYELKLWEKRHPESSRQANEEGDA